VREALERGSRIALWIGGPEAAQSVVDAVDAVDGVSFGKYQARVIRVVVDGRIQPPPSA
jgi:hypothetical protein